MTVTRDQLRDWIDDATEVLPIIVCDCPECAARADHELRAADALRIEAMRDQMVDQLHKLDAEEARDAGE